MDRWNDGKIEKWTERMMDRENDGQKE